MRNSISRSRRSRSTSANCLLKSKPIKRQRREPRNQNQRRQAADERKAIKMPYSDRKKRLEYLKKWRDLHRVERLTARPDHDRARHANRRARIYGAIGVITIDDVRAILTPSARCFYCNKSANEVKPAFGKKFLGIDHRKPLHSGGKNNRENLVPCCHSCNASKFRGEKPWKWARDFDACLGCGTSEKKHISEGFCNGCFWKYRYRKKIDSRSAVSSANTQRNE